jgi:protein-export membrane protein SecD
VALFLILWYRLPGFIAFISLSIYVILMLALFKLLPVTLTAAGIAGFIISIGIAVDANILIFERLKEELYSNSTVSLSVTDGFKRAWSSIRDSNLSTIISALILFWFGTPLIKGFALTLGLGVLVSMFSAIMISRIFLSGLVSIGEGKVARFLFNSGLSK